MRNSGKWTMIDKTSLDLRQNFPEVKRRTKSAENKVRRSCSRTYTLSSDEIYSIPLCKDFFLSTLWVQK